MKVILTDYSICVRCVRFKASPPLALGGRPRFGFELIGASSYLALSGTSANLRPTATAILCLQTPFFKKTGQLPNNDRK